MYVPKSIVIDLRHVEVMNTFVSVQNFVIYDIPFNNPCFHISQYPPTLYFIVVFNPDVPHFRPFVLSFIYTIMIK